MYSATMLLLLLQAPLLSSYAESDRWHLVVARLPQIETLNGSCVGDEQRIDSERFYIRHYANAELRPQR